MPIGLNTRKYKVNAAIKHNTLLKKPYFIFPNVPKLIELEYDLSCIIRKDGFSKNLALKYDLSCIIRKRLYFFFPKISSCSLDGKWNMIFLKKHMEDIFWKYSEKKTFPKNSHCKMIFPQLSRWYFYFPDIWSHPLSICSLEITPNQTCTDMRP